MPLEAPNLIDARKFLAAIVADPSDDMIRLGMGLIVTLQTVAANATEGERRSIGEVMVEVGSEILRGAKREAN